MKKFVYIFLLAAVIIFVSSRTTSKTAIADTKTPILKESDETRESANDSPRIHFLLHKNATQSNLSPALWWSYEPSKKDGC